MATKKSPILEKVRHYLQKHPNAKPDEVRDALAMPDLKTHTISHQKYTLRIKGRLDTPSPSPKPRQNKPKKKRKDERRYKPKQPIQSGESFNVRLSVPDGGSVVLKLDNCDHMIGTLHLTSTGIKYIPSKGKELPEREMPFRVLHGLMVSGLLND